MLYEALTYTFEKRIQESVGFYNPSAETIVFVFLPSRTGNSAAIWRRKVPVPELSSRAQWESIQNATSILRADYKVYVEELSYVPIFEIGSIFTGCIGRRHNTQPHGRGRPRQQRRKRKASSVDYLESSRFLRLTGHDRCPFLGRADGYEISPSCFP